MLCYSTALNPKLRKFLGKTKMAFVGIETSLLFVDFSKAFDSIHKKKMEQILLAYGLPRETVAAIMMLYKTRKYQFAHRMETNIFDIATGVLEGDTLAPYLFIICPDYVLETSIDLMKENGFTLENARNRQYPT